MTGFKPRRVAMGHKGRGRTAERPRRMATGVPTLPVGFDFFMQDLRLLSASD